jgi:hypothetical protein
VDFAELQRLTMLKINSKIRCVWLLWVFAMNPLGSAEIPSYHLIGMPKETVACRYDVEDVNCSPVVLSKERVRRKK